MIGAQTKQVTEVCKNLPKKQVMVDAMIIQNFWIPEIWTAAVMNFDFFELMLSANL
jgi:hypothetical protein